MALCEVALSDGSDLVAEEMKFGLGWNSPSHTTPPFCDFTKTLKICSVSYTSLIWIRDILLWPRESGLQASIQKIVDFQNSSFVFGDHVMTGKWKNFAMWPSAHPLILGCKLSGLSLEQAVDCWDLLFIPAAKAIWWGMVLNGFELKCDWCAHPTIQFLSGELVAVTSNFKFFKNFVIFFFLKIIFIKRKLFLNVRNLFFANFCRGLLTWPNQYDRNLWTWLKTDNDEHSLDELDPIFKQLWFVGFGHIQTDFQSYWFCQVN